MWRPYLGVNFIDRPDFVYQKENEDSFKTACCGRDYGYGYEEIKG